MIQGYDDEVIKYLMGLLDLIGVVWKNVPPRITGVDIVQVYPCCSGNL